LFDSLLSIGGLYYISDNNVFLMEKNTRNS